MRPLAGRRSSAAPPRARSAGAVAGSGRIVAIALGGGGLVARTSCGFIADGAEEAGAAAAEGLVGLEAPHRLLILLAEGLAGHHSEMVRGAYGVAGATVKLVGGCAGDDLAMAATWQIHGGQAYQGAVVGAALGSDGPIGVGVGHGWTRSGDPMVVTESDGQRIFRIDDQPALDRYLTQAGVPESEWGDVDAWPDLMLRTPLALPRPSGDDVRAVLSGDAGRSLACVQRCSFWGTRVDDVGEFRHGDIGHQAGLFGGDRGPRRCAAHRLRGV